MSVYLKGLGLGASLIIVIGAQNAFVLRQGLLRRHIFLTALICTLCDILLISAGVGGLGALATRAAFLSKALAWGGAAFLFLYGLLSLRRAFMSASLVIDDSPEQKDGTARATVLTALGFSLLNPHAILDTVVLLGSVGAGYQGSGRIDFALGASSASALWFFGLAFGSAALAPWLRRPGVWRVLDVVMGCVMWYIALGLVR